MSRVHQDIVDQLKAEWVASPLADEEGRREAIVNLVLTKMGTSQSWIRALVETIYDRLFPQSPPALSPEVDVCAQCGLNDGHHYAKCPNAARLKP
jgi:hypothetical protein